MKFNEIKKIKEKKWEPIKNSGEFWIALNSALKGDPRLAMDVLTKSNCGLFCYKDKEEAKEKLGMGIIKKFKITIEELPE